MTEQRVTRLELKSDKVDEALLKLAVSQENLTVSMKNLVDTVESAGKTAASNEQALAEIKTIADKQHGWLKGALFALGITSAALSYFANEKLNEYNTLKKQVEILTNELSKRNMGGNGDISKRQSSP